MNNYNDKVVEVENVRVNSKGLIDADSMPRIIISEKGDDDLLIKLF
jgi:hypothetical protein